MTFDQLMTSNHHYLMFYLKLANCGNSPFHFEKNDIRKLTYSVKYHSTKLHFHQDEVPLQASCTNSFLCICVLIQDRGLGSKSTAVIFKMYFVFEGTSSTAGNI